MINVKKVLANILSTTLCIESGTSNGWEYKKYSDGTFEAFKVFSLIIPSSGWTSGSGQYYSDIIDFGSLPFTIDVSKTVLAGSAGQQCKLINPSIGSTGYLGGRMERGSAATVSATALLIVMGIYT